MTIEADILTTLNNYAGLSALVSSRNYAVNLPQNSTYPNTVFFTVVTNPQNTLTGRNTLTQIRIQIDIRDTTLNGASLAATQVKKAIEAATLFDGLYINDSMSPREVQTETYRKSLDFSIWFHDLT